MTHVYQYLFCDDYTVGIAMRSGLMLIYAVRRFVGFCLPFPPLPSISIPIPISMFGVDSGTRSYGRRSIVGDAGKTMMSVQQQVSNR